MGETKCKWSRGGKAKGRGIAPSCEASRGCKEECSTRCATWRATTCWCARPTSSPCKHLRTSLRVAMWCGNFNESPRDECSWKDKNQAGFLLLYHTCWGGSLLTLNPKIVTKTPLSAA